MLMRGVHYGTLYKLLGSTYTNGCNSSIVLEQTNKEDKINIVPRKKTMLWHQRLGHIGEKGLRTLHGKGMVEGMFNCSLDFDFYEHWIYGKHNRVRLPSGATRAKGVLELIHSDVFGLVHVPSLGKSVYYVSFIYDLFVGYVLFSLHVCVGVSDSITTSDDFVIFSKYNPGLRD